MLNTEELEWYSNCCDAPPLNELHNAYEDTEPEGKVLGMCMKCREGAIFYLEGATDET